MSSTRGAMFTDAAGIALELVLMKMERLTTQQVLSTQ